MRLPYPFLWIFRNQLSIVGKLSVSPFQTTSTVSESPSFSSGTGSRYEDPARLSAMLFLIQAKPRNE